MALDWRRLSICVAVEDIRLTPPAECVVRRAKMNPATLSFAVGRGREYQQSKDFLV